MSYSGIRMSRDSLLDQLKPKIQDMAFYLSLASNLDVQASIDKYLEDPNTVNRARLLDEIFREGRDHANRQVKKQASRLDDARKNEDLDRIEAAQAYKKVYDMILRAENPYAFASGAAGSASGAAGSASGASGSASGAAGSASGASGSASGASGSASGAAGSASGASGQPKTFGLPTGPNLSETQKNLRGNRALKILRVTQQFNDALKTFVKSAEKTGFINLPQEGQGIVATLPDTGKAEEGKTLLEASEDFKKKLHSMMDAVVKYEFMTGDEAGKILAAAEAGTARKDKESSPEVVFISESDGNLKKKRKTGKNVDAIVIPSDTEDVPKPKAKKNLKKKQESLKKETKALTKSSESEDSFVAPDDESSFESDVSDTESSGDQSYKNPKKMDARKRSLRPRGRDMNYRDADDDDF
jgi:hypothetical protein